MYTDGWELLIQKEFIIFDMDGVIVDIENINYQAYKKTLRTQFKVNLTHLDYNVFFKGMKGFDSVPRYLKNRGIKIDDIHIIFTNIKFEKEKLLKKSNLIQYMLPGTKELLTFLSGKGKKIALATSTIQYFTEVILNGLSIKKFFSLIHTAESVSIGKPHPEIFLKSFYNLGGKDKSQGVVIEDSIAGAIAALSGGFDCIFIGAADPALRSVFESLHKKIVFYYSFSELINEGNKSQ